MFSVILLTMLMILLPTLSLIGFLISRNNQNWFLNFNLQDTMDQGRKWVFDINARKIHLFTDLATLLLLMWKWIGLFLRKNHLLRCWGWLSQLLKFPPRKLEPWSGISINLPYAHAWNTVVMLGLVLLAATWNCWINYKNICRTIGSFLTASIEPLTHCRNVTSLSIFYRYYFARFSCKLAQLVPFRGRSTRCSDRLHDFSVTVRRCYKDVYVSSFFPSSFLEQRGSGLFCL